MDIIPDKKFRYHLEKLDSTSVEYIFVKEFYNITTDEICRKEFYHISRSIAATKNSLIKATDYETQGIKLQICKVNENNPIKLADEKSNNLMLFHGTNRKGAEGILKEGFKNSKKGYFGKGVYMSDCSDVASKYAATRFSNNYCLYVFVNEVLESEKLQTLEFDASTYVRYHDTPLKHPFNKHIHKSSHQATEKDYKEDHIGRKYRNIGFEHDDSSAYDEYVADESVTIPRYLIIFQL